VAAARYEFDTVALFEALDRRREELGLTWTQVGAQVGVAPSTLTRTRQGLRMEADGMRAMVRWLGRAPEDFIVGPKQLAGSVPQTSSVPGRVRRVDTSSLYAVLDTRRAAEGRTWADLSAELDLSPGMLTRLARRGRIEAGVLARVVGYLGLAVEDFIYESDR
jgi:hypothetical protein